MARSKNRPSVLTVSGSDPSGGAGLEADLKVFQQHGVFGMAIPTLLTAQNSIRLRKVHFLDPVFFEEQWRAIFEVKRPTAIKIGALGSRAMVRKISRLLSRPEARGIPVVLDPVLGSTSGAGLLEPSALSDLQSEIFPRCRLITPNAEEFSILARQTGESENPGDTLAAYASGKKFAVLLKGGHLRGKNCSDFLWEGGLHALPGKRLRHSLHGTGCALASAIAANLALGFPLLEACRRGKAYVAKALASSLKTGERELDFRAGN